MAAHGGHTRASGGRTVKMNVPVLFPLRTSQCAKALVTAQPPCAAVLTWLVAMDTGFHARLGTHPPPILPKYSRGARSLIRPRKPSDT